VSCITVCTFTRSAGILIYSPINVLAVNSAVYQADVGRVVCRLNLVQRLTLAGSPMRPKGNELLRNGPRCLRKSSLLELLHCKSVNIEPLRIIGAACAVPFLLPNQRSQCDAVHDMIRSLLSVCGCQCDSLHGCTVFVWCDV